MSYQNVVDLVTEGQFVNPEKVTAIDLYGFEKAKKMWENGEPDFTTRLRLSNIACQKALLGQR